MKTTATRLASISAGAKKHPVRPSVARLARHPINRGMHETKQRNTLTLVYCTESLCTSQQALGNTNHEHATAARSSAALQCGARLQCATRVPLCDQRAHAHNWKPHKLLPDTCTPPTKQPYALCLILFYSVQLLTPNPPSRRCNPPLVRLAWTQLR